MDRGEFRQWAMIHAMQGVLAGDVDWQFEGKRVNTPEGIAKIAMRIADALLEANTIDDPEPAHD